MIEEVMSLWRMYSYEYRTILADYKRLRQEAANRKIPIGTESTVNNSDIKYGFPPEEGRIGGFLSIPEEKEAYEVLRSYRTTEISRLRLIASEECIDQTGYAHNYVRRSLLVAIKNIEYRLKHHGAGNMFGINPEACSGAPKRIYIGARAASDD